MKYIYLTIGMICLALGAVGALLPILPTTPFLLISAYCFAKSSKRVHDWFISTSLYQKHLDSFVKNRAMTLKTKMIILASASIMLAFPLVLSNNLHLRIFIICLYIIKYYYFLFRIDTIREERKIL